MHLSGAIETFLVFLPRRANHRGIARFAAACNSLHTCRLSIPYTWFVNSARERERERDARVKEIERIGRVKRGEITILITIDRTTPSIETHKDAWRIRILSGDILQIPQRIFYEQSLTLHKIKIFFIVLCNLNKTLLIFHI